MFLETLALHLTPLYYELLGKLNATENNFFKAEV